MCQIRDFTVHHLSLDLNKPISSSYIKAQCESWRDHLGRTHLCNRPSFDKICEMGVRIDRVIELFEQVSGECGFILAYNLMLEYIELKWGGYDDTNEFCIKKL
jgi:hypothetical protein